MLLAGSTTQDRARKCLRLERDSRVYHSGEGTWDSVSLSVKHFYTLSGMTSTLLLHCSLGKGQKSLLPSQSPRGAEDPLLNKRPPQICPGQPCQEKCLLCAGHPLRSPSCFDVLGAPKRGSSSIIHSKHLVEGSGSFRGLLPPPRPTARLLDSQTRCIEGSEAATLGTRPRPMPGMQPKGTELGSEVRGKLWDALGPKGAPITLKSLPPWGLHSPSPGVSTPPWGTYPLGFSNPGLHRPGFPPTPESPPSLVSMALGSPVLGSSQVRMCPPGRARRARTHRFLERAGRGRWWPCGTPGDAPAAAGCGGHGPACSPRGGASLSPRPAPGGRRRPGRSAPQPALGAVTTRAAAPPGPPPPPQPSSLHSGKFGHRQLSLVLWRERGARLRLSCRDVEVTPPARRCGWKVQVAL